VTTVVIPAAGTGSRFGAAYPKELHALRPGTAVIDVLMQSICRLDAPDLRVVVVISSGKLDLVRHLEQYSSQLALSFVYQTVGQFGRLPAALTSAEPFCDQTVLVCLADQVYLADPVEVLGQALSRVNSRSSMVVVATPCTDRDRLSAEGALAVDHTELPVVARAAEKPVDTSPFNACWSSFACERVMLREFAVELTRGGETPSLVGAPVLWGPDFINITCPADAWLTNRTVGTE
jgi:UTP-glucose-1-phosphate uridylyltransferase